VLQSDWLFEVNHGIGEVRLRDDVLRRQIIGVLNDASEIRPEIVVPGRRRVVSVEVASEEPDVGIARCKQEHPYLLFVTTQSGFDLLAQTGPSIFVTISQLTIK
jgi:hypothetical protein